ncbi:hypothetical protein CS063_12565 [Sporanaerobium hydrogeniformans]|uniref:Uncharacterized protein n=1 Tax=Sporanaerobium hydrogeniformans TaxID=3072179 RepID=A0AC61D9P1_9FIRM|nr:methyl-accepting chemotaxis protein [Sporanaerobium hydrogeniformans]PHV69974.1 hypothetical protein CS063_12565 [Sporanaerobium hydrogeniformans]
MKLKLRGRIYLAVIPMFFVLTLTLMSLSVYSTRIATDKTIYTELNTNMYYYEDITEMALPGPYFTDGTTLLKGEIDLSTLPLLDELKSRTTFDYTLFLGDTRLLTTLDASLLGTKADPNVVEKVLENGETFTTELQLEAKPYLAQYKPLKDKNGEAIGMIFIGLDLTPYNKEFNALITLNLSIGIILSLITLIVVTFAVGSISTKINKVVNHLALLTTKDFTKHMDARISKRTDEIGELARGLETMQASIVSILSDVHKLTMGVRQEAKALAHTSQKLAEHSEKVVAATEEITVSVTDEAHDLLGINDHMGNLSHNIGTLAHSMGNIDTHSSQIGEHSTSSKAHMESTLSSIYLFSDNFTNYMQEMKSFEEKINKVSEITQTIDSIADQTNLLALNAAIEAARAGESGKGFSVVAEEIRKLAEESQNSVQGIANIITSLLKTAQALAASTTSMNENLINQVNNIEKNAEVFQEIATSIATIIPEIQTINHETKEIDHKKATIVERIHHTSSISQAIAAACEEVASSTEEVNAVVEEVTSLSTELDALTHHLSKELKLFKLPPL